MLTMILLAVPAWADDWTSFNDSEGWSLVSSALVSCGSSDKATVRVDQKAIGGVQCARAAVLLTGDRPSQAGMAAVVQNLKQYSEWTPPAVRWTLSIDDAGTFAQLLQLPPPTANRYWVLNGASVWVNGSFEYRWKRVPASNYPSVVQRAVEDSYMTPVETPVNWGHWLIRPEASGLWVEYGVCTDLGNHLSSDSALGGIAQFEAAKRMPDNLCRLVSAAYERFGSQ